MLQQHFKDFFLFTRVEDSAHIQNLMNDVSLHAGKIINDPSIAHLKVDSNDLTDSVAKFSNKFEYRSLQTFINFLDKVRKLEDTTAVQKTLFEEERAKIFNYVQNMIARSSNPKLHLVFQSKGVMTKYYLDAYKLVNEYIFANEVQKTTYLVEKIVEKVIRANNTTDPNHKFGINDLVKFIIVGSDLHKYIKKNLHKLPSVIDLGYIRYVIDEELSASISKMIEDRERDTNKITNITCAFNSFTFFMVAAGFDNNRVLAEVNNIRKLMRIDYLQIERDFHELDWTMPMKAKIRKYQDHLWMNRDNMYEVLQYYARANDLEMNMGEVKERFEESKGYVIDGFDVVMDDVISCELAAEDRPDNLTYDEFMAKQLSFRYGEKNYAQINEKIGYETKRAMGILFAQYESLIRHMMFLINSEENQQIIAMESDPRKR